MLVSSYCWGVAVNAEPYLARERPHVCRRGGSVAQVHDEWNGRCGVDGLHGRKCRRAVRLSWRLADLQVAARAMGDARPTAAPIRHRPPRWEACGVRGEPY